MQDKLINDIIKRLGNTIKRLRSNEDEYQIFWLGVYEALPRIDKSRDHIPYLISSGFGAIKNNRRSEMSVDLARYCSHCGRYFGFRTIFCPECHIEMKLIRRHSDYEDYAYKHLTEVDYDNEILIDQFISILEGRKKYIAKRWLKDRADLFHQNHTKQIAFELDISAPAVSKYKKIIKKEFLEWYYQ